MPSCTPCRHGRRSPATTASRAGAASPAGRACRSAFCSTRPALRPEARFVVFHCYDSLGGGLSGPIPYYESCDLADARHPQTILAYGLNGAALPVRNGAPIRVRIERQLGYKMAKYLHTIELAESLAGFGRGRGGYWEDTAGYDWYAGI